MQLVILNALVVPEHPWPRMNYSPLNYPASLGSPNELPALLPCCLLLPLRLLLD